MSSAGQGLRMRLILAVGLLLAALALFLLDESLSGSSSKPVPPDPSLSAIIEQLLKEYGVGGNQVRTWHVKTPNGSIIRTERRVLVPRGFPAVEFNRDLNKAMLSHGARVAGTERTKESVVVLHVVQHGQTVQTISLVEEAGV
jgi:hypothetical protein